MMMTRMRLRLRFGLEETWGIKSKAGHAQPSSPRTLIAAPEEKRRKTNRISKAVTT